MANPTPLTGSTLPIQISTTAFHLQAPGLKGVCKEMSPTEKPTRAVGMPDPQHDQMMQALALSEAQMVKAFEIEVFADDFAGAGDKTTRSGGLQARTAEGEAAMVLTTPKPRPDMNTVVFYTDENGESRWIFPESIPQTDRFQFNLPREKAEMPEEQDPSVTVRGAITKGIRRIVKVISWVTDELIGALAHNIATKWEEKRRPYGFFGVEPGKIAPEVPWDRIREKRSLLLLHGTFSTGQAAFDGLINGSHMQQLSELYEGRIFAFNHPSMHHTPAENVAELMRMLPPEARLEVDIITHSRGGLVGREICQRLPEINPTDKQLKVRRALFVAGPHAGTILTDNTNWVKLIDAYTNLLTSLPDNPFTITMEAIITLVKVVGGGALHGLPGLQAMLPGGDYIKRLNASVPGDTRYYGMGASYAPGDDKALVRFGKRLLMMGLAKIFGENSDMVVPTKGCFEVDSTIATLPIPETRRRLYELDMDINHLNFFQKDQANQQLLNWLRESD